MASDNYVNNTGLAYFWNRIKTVFADKTAFETLQSQVQDIVAEGGEPNTIETISVNGTNVAPDASKNVNVTALQGVSVDLFVNNQALENMVAFEAGQANYGYNITVPSYNFGDGFTTGDMGGAVTSVSFDASAFNVSEFPNDSGYQTASDVSAAVNSAVSSAYIYKGSVATVDDLPATGQTTGAVYDVQTSGMNYAWNGTAWDALGQYVDTSLFVLASELTAMTTAQIDEILED